MLKKAILGVLNSFGYTVMRKPYQKLAQEEVVPAFECVHYGSARNYMAHWLNLDIIASGPENYMYVDLANRHPFPDNSFRFGFSEDFIEHLDQANSLLFLVEAHRTLKKGGVLRLCFPVLDNVLKKHFSNLDFQNFSKGKDEAYDSLGHLHFYSTDSLRLVANHIGFEVEVVEFGKSKHQQLIGINTRNDIVYLHVELTKR